MHKLVIADEPTPGMSQGIQEAMQRFRVIADAGAAVLLITHDIDLAIGCAGRAAVFHAGTAVWTAKASDFTAESRLRLCTKALWCALPKNGLKPYPGSQPNSASLPEGCLFAPCCLMKTGECLSGGIGG